jgi:hypothetical protein
MPTSGTAAEFGSGNGAFAESIVRITQSETLYLVDQWESDEERQAVERRFSEHQGTIHFRGAEPISERASGPWRRTATSRATTTRP